MVAAATVSSPEGALVLSPRDTDADGMPDGWEAHYTGSGTEMSATADNDGDGMVNLHECIAGTDPLNEESVLALNDVTLGLGETVLIEWQSATNRFYTIGRCTNLFDTFRPVATNIPATPPVNVHEDVTEGRRTLFYRIEVEE